MKKILILTIFSAVLLAFQPDIQPVQVQDDHPVITNIQPSESVFFETISIQPMDVMYAFQENPDPVFTPGAGPASTVTGPADLEQTSSCITIEKGWNKLLS